MRKGTNIETSRVTSSRQSGTVRKGISVNEDYLKKTLKLLGVTDQQFQKQCRIPLKQQLFPKTLLSATSSKQFFFICFYCAKNLMNSQQDQELSMWYPPRNVNQQIEFKKTFFKILQRMQARGVVPKNLILGKMVLMGQGSGQSILEFLRILSELSLRALYLEKYSKTDRLIQVGVNSGQFSSENDINRFYVFPFNETVTNIQPPMKSDKQMECTKKMLEVYIQRYRKKILSLRTVDEVEGINPQGLMSQILQQKQLATTLQNKVNKSIYSQNRAFDRRVIMDKNAQIWKQLFDIPCNFIDQDQSSVLKVQGETAGLLSGWRPVSGTPNLIEFNSNSQQVKELKSKCQQKIGQLKQLKQIILTKMKKSRND